MKLPIYLIGEDSLAMASLRQQLEKEPAFSIESRVHNYADAFDHLRGKTGPIVAVIDLNRDEERAFAVAAEIKFKLPNVHLVMTAPDDNHQTLLRAMRSGAEEFIPQPFNWTEVLNSFDSIRKKIETISPERFGTRPNCSHILEQRRCGFDDGRNQLSCKPGCEKEIGLFGRFGFAVWFGYQLS